jgi:hypothetical protein
MSAPMRADADPSPEERSRLRAANLRTAWILASIAAVFFVGIIASKFLGSPSTSISVIGAAVLLFLVVAIGRNLRR